VEDVARFLHARGGEWTGGPSDFHAELPSRFKHERPEDLGAFLTKRPEFGYHVKHAKVKKDDGSPTTVRRLRVCLENGVNGVNGVNGEERA
jgi:hypothetical protein